MLEVLDLGSSSQVHRQWKQTVSDPASFSYEQIKSYWENIFLNLDFPRSSKADLSIAVPCYYDCLNRSIMTNILTQNYGFQKIALLPRPLALVCGYITLHPEDAALGDWLCIFTDEDKLDFSFISISESCISLELQHLGSWTNCQEEAERLGLFSAEGWHIRKLLYADPAPNKNSHLPWVDLDNQLHVIRLGEPDKMILMGLNLGLMMDTAQSEKSLGMIYPYDFYLERFNPLTKQSIREKLSFDTANLELALNGSYKIASLPAPSLYLNPEDSYQDLAVYEVARSPWLPNPFNGPPAFNLRLNQAEQLDCLDIWLDMESASISMASNGPQSIPKESPADTWLAHIHKQQRDLPKLLQIGTNQALQQHLNQHLLTQPSQESSQDLEDYLKTIQLKLYGLLELWSGVK